MITKVENYLFKLAKLIKSKMITVHGGSIMLLVLPWRKTSIHGPAL